MKAWRVTLALGLLALAGVPLSLPLVEAISKAAPAEFDGSLFLRLAATTFALTAGAAFLALGIGVVLAALLFRTDLPGRGLLLVGTVFAVFVPLPVVVSAWQALLGSDGLFPLWIWGPNITRPWSESFLPAVWLHALAGLPWVILIVGVGLSSVESELEEEALLATGPWRVLTWVTLPRCRGSIVAAVVWVALQTATDINVAAILQTPTFAEEIDKQFNMGGAGLAQAVLLTLPAVLAGWLALILCVPRLERSLPPLQLGFARMPTFALGKARWLALLLCVLAAGAIVAAPLLALVWKLGLAGTPRAWSIANAVRQFAAEASLFGVQVLEMFIVALITGLVAATAALVLCWSANEHRPFSIFLLGVMALAWVMPGPLVGIGLKAVIMAIVGKAPLEPIETMLYFGPSPVPLIWADILRFLPYAVAILWPALRLVPTELVEAARLEGATPCQELLFVCVPLTRRSFFLAALAVTALSMSEVGASARVETPNWESFAKLIFDRMHYGADSNVAALSLVLLTGIAAAFMAGCVLRWWLRSRPTA